MPTDWLNMSTTLPRNIVFPTQTRRFSCAAFFILFLVASDVLWNFLQRALVGMLLWIIMFPINLVFNLSHMVPIYSDSVDSAGHQVPLIPSVLENASKFVASTSESTLGRLQNDVFFHVLDLAFRFLMSVSIMTWVRKNFTMANVGVSESRPTPFVFWREALSLACNFVLFYSMFKAVYDRVTTPPTGDSTGGIESFLFMISESLEALAALVSQVLIRTSRLELRLLYASLKSGIEGQVDISWKYLRLTEVYPLSLFPHQAKALMWISVGCSLLDLMLVFMGDGRRVCDHLLQSRLIMARLEGAGGNDAWQFATTSDINIRLGIVLALQTNRWPHTAVLMTMLLSLDYVYYFLTYLYRKMAFLWEDPRTTLTKDQAAREKRQEQQRLMAELAADPANRRSQNAVPTQGLNLAERTKKYAPNVYRDLAGHDWAQAGEGQAAGGGGGADAGLRRRKGGLVPKAGTVAQLESMAEWAELRKECEASGRMLVVLYKSMNSGGGEIFRGLVKEFGGPVFAELDVSVGDRLQQLSAEGVRFTGRFPVVHVYDGTKKVDQMMGADEAEMRRVATHADSLTKEAGAASSSPAKSSSSPAKSSSFAQGKPTPNPFRQPEMPVGGGGVVRELRNKGEFDALIQLGAGESLVVVDFTATWCGPCQRIKPAFHSMAAEFPQAFFCQVDVDENEETAAACKVSSMPTFQFYKRGKMVHSMKGANEPALRQAVEQFV